MIPLWSILVCKIPQFLAKSYRFGYLIILLESGHPEATNNPYYVLFTRRSLCPFLRLQLMDYYTLFAGITETFCYPSSLVLTPWNLTNQFLCNMHRDTWYLLHVSLSFPEPVSILRFAFLYQFLMASAEIFLSYYDLRIFFRRTNFSFMGLPHNQNKLHMMKLSRGISEIRTDKCQLGSLSVKHVLPAHVDSGRWTTGR